MADPRKPKQPGMEVYWTTVTYRTVWLLALTIVAASLVIWYFVHRESFVSVLNKVTETIGGTKSTAPPMAANNVRFVNLDGRVEIRKVGSADWRAADHQMSLDKGDVIRTGGDGIAKISFANGTTYVVKPDSLITVESNTMGETQQQMRPAVHIRSGAVDLSTTTSGAEVTFEDATAQLRENSRAAVRTDPESNQHEITVQSGAGELQRGGQRVQLAQYERVSFPTGGEITLSKVLSPPELTSPVNLTPVFLPDSVEFRWKPVQEAVSYHLRVSTSSMFNQIVGERKVTTPAADLKLPKGEYFWAVTAQDARKGSSESSEVRKLTVYEEQKAGVMLLELDPPKFHGNVVEITGRTEPGATLLIQGQTVPNIGADGRFRFFTQPLPRGSHEIKVVGQNRRGLTANKPIKVAIS